MCASQDDPTYDDDTADSALFLLSVRGMESLLSSSLITEEVTNGHHDTPQERLDRSGFSDAMIQTQEFGESVLKPGI